MPGCRRPPCSGGGCPQLCRTHCGAWATQGTASLRQVGLIRKLQRGILGAALGPARYVLAASLRHGRLIQKLQRGMGGECLGSILALWSTPLQSVGCSGMDKL